MASLLLKSRDIYWVEGQTYDPNQFWPTTVTVDTPIGTISTGKTIVTFKNINLRELMGGDIYDNAEMFQMDLQQFTTIPFSAGQASGNVFASIFAGRQNPIRQNVAMRVGGLPWVNSAYSVEFRTNRDKPLLCTICNYFETEASHLAGFGLFNNPDFGYVGGTNSKHGKMDGDYQYESPIPLRFRKPNSHIVNLEFYLSPEYLDVESMVPSSSIINASIFNIAWDWILRLKIKDV